MLWGQEFSLWKHPYVASTFHEPFQLQGKFQSQVERLPLYSMVRYLPVRTYAMAAQVVTLMHQSSDSLHEGIPWLEAPVGLPSHMEQRALLHLPPMA